MRGVRKAINGGRGRIKNSVKWIVSVEPAANLMEMVEDLCYCIINVWAVGVF